ncbi:hypothetical protein [Sphaerothrix gracilis]|uniref:hypothetical protein n=1 Tax=Sphaerothrix gracilis TaxID=3151835 RepID=UPI0031FDC434
MSLDINEKNQRYQEKEDIELPEWTGKLVKYSYLGFGLFLLVSSLFLLGCSSAGASDGLNWQSATSVISEERAREIVEENSSESADIDAILEAMQVFQSDELLLVDFNSPLLTGRLGTLHVIYDSEGNRIFNRYLPSRLPGGVPTLHFSERTSDGYPCLLINAEPTETEITQYTLCYQGADWVVVNEAVVSY